MSEPVPSRAPSPMTDADRKAEMRRWVERWSRLQAATDDELMRQSADLLNLWQPDVPGDDGEGIVLHQRVFARPGGSPNGGPWTGDR